MRKYFRIIYYFGGVLLFLVTAVIGYTQTRSFKTYLREFLLRESVSALNGDLQFGSIEGNLITGFKISDVSITKSGTELLSAQRIELKYDPFGVPFKRIGISNVVIVKPRVYICRSIDGSTNIAELIKPTPPAAGPSVWNIDIKRLELMDAEVLYIDSLLLHQRETGECVQPPDSAVDYARIHLRSLELVASFQIQQNNTSIKIKQLSASIHRDTQFLSAGMVQAGGPGQAPVLNLEHGGGDFLLTTNQVSVSNLRIETPGTHLRCDAALKGIDILRLSTLEELKNVPVELSLTADEINTKELKQLLYPYVDFLDRSFTLHLEAKGPFSDIHIEKLALLMPHSSVNLQGHIRNLHRPHDLEMTVQAYNNVIESDDLREHLPGLQLPDLTYLGVVTYSLSYEGRPLDFKARFDGSTAVGDLHVNGQMKIDQSNPSYSGTIGVHSLALENILHNKNLTSNLNATVTVNATGFNPRTMTGVVKVEMDSSSIRGVSIHHSVVVFDVAENNIRSHVAASLGSGTYEFSNLLTFLHEDSMNYSISGRIRSLDLNDVLNDPKYDSDLSFDLAAAGTIGLSTRTDSADLHFYRSTFFSQPFESAQANVQYHMKDSTHHALHITSTVGDLNVLGNFTPASFIAAWQNSYQLVTEGVAYRFRSLDSIRSFAKANAPIPPFHPLYTGSVNHIDARYGLVVKNFTPIGAFIHVPLAGQGKIEGTIVGDSLDMRLTGKADLDQFELDAGTDTLMADTASIRYQFGGIGYDNLFQQFSASVQPELGNFVINGLLFNRIGGNVTVHSDSSTFQFSALIDSTAAIDVEGKSRVRENLMEFEIPTLKTGFKEYLAENQSTVRLTLGRDGSHINPFALIHGQEGLVIGGHFSPTGISDLNFALNNFTLTDLKQLLHRGPYARLSTQFSGLVDATTQFRGSFKHPNIVIDMHADNVQAFDSLQNKRNTLGKIDAHLSYFEYILGMDIKCTSQSGTPQAQPDLLLAGSLPYNFVLSREEPHTLEGSVDLTLKSTGMNLEMLDPFIPVLSNLSGRLTCDMKMNGPIDAPQYQGSMSIRNAKFIFDPLGLPYILNGDLVPSGNRIQLKDFTIQNDPEERLHVGTMKVSGNFTLLGLTFKQFDLLAQGDLKVMSEEKRLPGQKLYGNLFAATGPSGLVWQGDLNSSTVRGEVFIKDASLILPPERETESIRTGIVAVTYKDDTSRIASVSIDSVRSFGGKNKMAGKSTKGKNAITPLSQMVHSTFLDGINYDVYIETQGTTTLHFIFSTQTGEELFADLQGRLYFNRTPTLSRLTGQVEAGNRSYYYLIKKFDATGKLTFTGDILNPELNVTATYQGTHDTTSTSNQLSTPTSGISGSRKAPQVLVTVKITGTRNEPKTKLSLQTKKYSDNEWTSSTNWREGDDEANAASYILTGQFRDELTDQQRMGLIGTNLGFALAWGSVNGLISEAVRKSTWGYIQSVDVIYLGGQFSQSTDLRLTGQVGEAVIRAGGQVLSDLTNANVSVELPMSTIVNSERYRNLILTLERRVEGIQNAQEQPRASNGVRLYYRIIF